jgi:hypothetical protein
MPGILLSGITQRRLLYRQAISPLFRIFRRNDAALPYFADPKAPCLDFGISRRTADTVQVGKFFDGKTAFFGHDPAYLFDAQARVVVRFCGRAIDRRVCVPADCPWLGPNDRCYLRITGRC